MDCFVRFITTSIICWALTISSISFAADKSRVLIIYSLPQQIVWQSELEIGFLNRVKEITRGSTETNSTTIHTLRLDLIADNLEKALEEQLDLIRRNLLNNQYETIITVGDLAAYSISQASDAYIDSTIINIARIDPMSFTESFDIEITQKRVLESIVTTYPDINRLIYIGSENGSISFRDIWEFNYSDRFSFDLWDEQMPLSLKLELVKQLKVGDLIYFNETLSFHGSNDIYPIENLEKLAAIANVPIYVSTTSHLIEGVAGGLVINPQRIGQQLADIAYDINSTDSPSPIHFRFNYSAVETYGLDIGSLRAPVEIIGSPAWVFTEQEMISFGAAFLLLVSFSGVAWGWRVKLSNHTLMLEVRKNSELSRDLAVSKMRSDLALEAAGVGIITVGLDSGEISVDAGFRKLYGFNETEIIGFADFDKRIHPDDLKMVRAMRDTVYTEYSNTNIIEETYRILPVKGQHIWCRFRFRHHLIDGKPFAVGCVYSIDNEMKALDRLVASCKATDMRLIDFNVTKDSGTWLEKPNSGVSIPLVGKPLILAVPENHRQPIINLYEGKVDVAVFPIVLGALSEKKWVRNQVVERWVDSSGDQHMLITSLNITKDMSAQFALEKAKSVAEKALDDLNYSAEMGGVGLISIDLMTELFEVNSVFRSMFQFSKTEYPQICFDDFFSRVPKEQRSTRQQVIDRLKTDQHSEALTVSYCLPDGSQMWCRVELKSILKDEKVVEVAGSFIDITKQRELSEELKKTLIQKEKLLKEMQLKQERQQQMFAVIGHELRTPAAALNMMLNARNTEDTGRYDAEILDTSGHLLEVLDDLRTLVEPNILKERTLSAGNPFEVIESCLLPLKDKLDNAGISVLLKADFSFDEMYLFDTRGLRQVATNLIKNSALHSGASKLIVNFKIEEFTDKDSMLVLSFVDNGKGIPESEQNLIFEPFTRGDTTEDGTGLGLHICREILQASEGELVLSTAPQGGCSFRLHLPLKVIPKSSEHEKIEAATKSDLSGLQVLIAEDNATLRMLTEQIVKGIGGSPSTANNGAIALKLLQEQPVDLLLTDIFMPEMDGFELVTSVRKLGFTLPIIGVTAAMVGDESQRLLAAGANHVIAKPVTREKLLQAYARLSSDQIQ